MTTLPPDPSLVEKLVLANRMLCDQQVLDGFGHVSVRHDKSPDRFLLARSMAPALVKREDIMTLDLDGNPLDADGRAPYLERFIHGAIYRARPEVQAVIHSHSPSVIPFAATHRPLQPLYHMSAFLGAGSAFFDIHDVAGNSDMLIRDNALGTALAAALGERSMVLMRGHGSTLVGSSLEQAVYRAVYAELNARLQAQAHALGTVTYLNEEEAAKAATTNDAQVGRPWELWRQAIGPID